MTTEPSGAPADNSPRLADESQWYTEHSALLVSTFKWSLLGAGAGLCVGFGTRGFLWAVVSATAEAHRLTGAAFQPYWLLPLAIPLSVWLVRTFAPDARGHGTEAVIAAVHQRSGKIDWLVAPVKLLATVVTLAFGGSVGKEGPAAQIGAALTSLLADILRLTDRDRRALVICGISAGFASVFGTPVSGALFGIEVLYLGRIDYSVIFPALVAGIVGHLAAGVRPPFPTMNESIAASGQFTMVIVAILSGLVFGLAALLLIETLRATDHAAKRFRAHPYLVATLGGLLLVAAYSAFGDRYAGLGTETIDGLLAGTLKVSAFAFLIKIGVTAITLETGGSGGILTPVFFVGTTSGATLATLIGFPPSILSAFGFIAVLAAAANTPLAAAVMAIEILPSSVGVYAALAAATAYLMVGHRSVYASQKLGFSKSGGLDVPLGGSIGDIERSDVRLRKGSLTERLSRRGN